MSAAEPQATKPAKVKKASGGAAPAPGSKQQKESTSAFPLLVCFVWNWRLQNWETT